MPQPRGRAWSAATVPPRDIPIGVFDSGIGGLTVFGALARRLPGEHLLYLGDTARVPYGTRSADTVVRYAERVAGHLLGRGIKALVVACNTATTWALPALQRTGQARGIPVIGVIKPGVLAALATTRRDHFAVIGTEGTIQGGRYTQQLPLLRSAIQSTLPGVHLVDSATATADATAEPLSRTDLLRNARQGGRRRFLVTDNPQRFVRVAHHFLSATGTPGVTGWDTGTIAPELVDIKDSDHAVWHARIGAQG